MPKIIAAAHAFPPHAAPQGAVKEAVRTYFASRLPGLEQYLGVFDNARIERRQFVRPLEWYLEPKSPVERNDAYLAEGLELLIDAARDCLASAALPPEAVDHIICVSSTGHATPTLDARLINELGLRRTVTRLPVWGLGCAGGAAGLSRAADYCRAYPRATVLVVALECCSLAFAEGELSKKDLVAAALFSDGAAAALVSGSEAPGRGPRLAATRSYLFADSYRVMGWDFLEQGMALVLSPKLPAIVKEALPELISDFLSAHDLSLGDLVHYVTHPGGAKVIDAYLQALPLTPEDLSLTEEVLRQHGNISSVSVLVVLEKWLASPAAQRQGYGLLSAFGPGFSAELALLKV